MKNLKHFKQQHTVTWSNVDTPPLIPTPFLAAEIYRKVETVFLCLVVREK